jgi:hypothetical protein
MSTNSAATMGRIQSREARMSISTDRTLLRLSAMLLFLGELISLVAGFFHPDQAPANDHHAAFAGYAASVHWTAIHLGQFAGMAVIITGLLALFFALNVHAGALAWIARLGALVAAVTLALYGVLQAVDGVALKQAVDAWASAPDAEKSVRFASAEAIRWLEWGVRSYQSFLLGLTFLLFAIVIMWTARTSRVIGVLMGLSGLAYLAQGWVIGSEGFSATNSIPTLVGIVATLVWSIWLLISAWRMQASVEAPTR